MNKRGQNSAFRALSVVFIGLSLGGPEAVLAAEPEAIWTELPTIDLDASGVVSLDAYTDWIEVPGLGRVDGVSFYDLHIGKNEHPKPLHRRLLPPILQVAKGTVLELHLHNRLATVAAADLGKPNAQRMADPTNVHTHGLIVPPTGIGFGQSGMPRLGDCVLPVELSQAAGQIATGHNHDGKLTQDPCSSTVPANMAMVDNITYSYPIASDHPSGLYWIHPHPHGQSEIQLSNGLSGLLSVGSIWDSIYFKCRLTASPMDAADACRTQEEQREERALRKRAQGSEGEPGLLRVRYLGLKDIQIEKRKGSSSHEPQYDLIPFPWRPPGKADAAFTDANNARKTRCGDPPRPLGDGDVDLSPGKPTPRGVCWSEADSGRMVGWAFPVSGQVYPHIEVEPGTTELWRFANMSADVSYRLQLKGTEGQLYRMRPVAIDGVAISAPPINQSANLGNRTRIASTTGLAIEEIVLMPSARIEVVIERCAADQGGDLGSGCIPAGKDVKAVLRTRGMATGLGDQGDKWPAIDLAEVHFEGDPRSTTAALPSHKALLSRVKVANAPVKTPEAKPIQAPGDKGAPSGAAPAARAAIDSGPCTSAYDHGPAHFPLTGTQVRLIRLKNDTIGADEAFGIHDQLFDLARLSDSAPVTLGALVDEGASPANELSLIQGLKLPEPCTDIHTIEGFQQYYLPFDPKRDNVEVKYGTEEYWLVINDSAECHNFHVHQMKFSVVDADFRGSSAILAGSTPPTSDQCGGDRTAVRPINQAALLDNYPLPPSARVLFRLKFDGPKLGRFVFHCHILEHEDKGMMGLLKVVE
jgi:FtsP/CotA-like multicopper oxidase with cupredoxin domain